MRAADLHHLARRLREAAVTATSDPGEPRVGYGELAVVEDLAHHPGSTVGEVALRTGLAQSLVSRLATRLADAGVLTASQDPADRRRTRLAIDPGLRAEVLQPRGDRGVRPALAATFPDLDEDRLDELEELLGRLVALVRPAG